MVPAEIENLMSELKTGFTGIYGERLRGVYLFGSFARSEQQPDSDVDVLIVLDQISSYAAEVDRTGVLNSTLSLRYGLSVSRVFLAEHDWRSADSPFLLNVRDEAVSA